MYNPWFVQYNRKTLRYKKTANGKIITIQDCQRPGLFSTRQSPELKRDSSWGAGGRGLCNTFSFRPNIIRHRVKKNSPRFSEQAFCLC